MNTRGEKGKRNQIKAKNFDSRLRPYHEEGWFPGKQLLCLPQDSRALGTVAYGFPRHCSSARKSTGSAALAVNRVEQGGEGILWASAFIYERQGGWRDTKSRGRRWKQPVSSPLPVPHSPSCSEPRRKRKGVWGAGHRMGGASAQAVTRGRQMRAEPGWNLPCLGLGSLCKETVHHLIRVSAWESAI